MSHIQQIKIGDKTEFRHQITREDIQKFIDLTGDDNKIHTNNDFAKNTPLKTTVAHGMLGASFISTVIGTKLPGDGALWLSQSLNFLRPVRVNDEITVIAEVIKVDKRRSIIELETVIHNQHKQDVVTGNAKVKILSKKGEVRENEDAGTRTALVVGATGGIGEATCLRLAADGFNVIVHYHSNASRARELKQKVGELGRESMVVAADIVNDADVRQMKNDIERKFDTIEVLVNCSTIAVPNIKWSCLDWTDIEKHFSINIKGAFNLVKELVPLMEKKQYGKIVHLTTQYIESPSPELLGYVTAKAALSGFSKALALELAPKGIRVNMVSPGLTNTSLIKDVPEKTRLLTEAKTPLKKLASPQDIANCICFLASNQSDHMTGETLRINGGQLMI